MPLVSVTRVRLRSMRFLPVFFVHSLRAQAQRDFPSDPTTMLSPTQPPCA